MCEKIRSYISKYRCVIIYLLFGVLTTAVNYIVYYPLYNIADFSATISNIVAWLAAVVFAYFTNKWFVFQSKTWNREVVVPEFLKFVGCRLFSGVAETLLLFVLVDQLAFNGNVWKVLTSISTVILNYIFSKFIVFKNSP